MLANLAAEAFLLKFSLLIWRARKILALEPAEEAGVVNKFQAACAFAGRNEDMGLILIVVEANATLLKYFLHVYGGAEFHAAHGEIGLRQAVAGLAGECW